MGLFMGVGQLILTSRAAYKIHSLLPTVNKCFKFVSQELDERSFPELTRNRTFGKDIVPLDEASRGCTVSLTKTPPSLATTVTTIASHGDELSGMAAEPTKERTPARPRRNNIQYVGQPIRDIALAAAVPEPETELNSGLMFIRVSPGKQEKRKPSQERTASVEVNQGKRSRVAEARTAAASVRGRACASDRLSTARAPMQRTISSRSVTGGTTSRRSSQPRTGKLSLAKSSTVRQAEVVHHPNPFAARNRYYDERWVEKQERGFSHWLNFVLTPQDLEDTTTAAQSVTSGIARMDVARLWSQCSQDVRVLRAPSREVMSMRAYTARREMNRLRRDACRLWQSREVATVISKLEIEIERLRLAIRKVRDQGQNMGILPLS